MPCQCPPFNISTFQQLNGPNVGALKCPWERFREDFEKAKKLKHVIRKVQSVSTGADFDGKMGLGSYVKDNGIDAYRVIAER